MSKHQTPPSHKPDAVNVHKARLQDAPAIAALAQELEDGHSLCEARSIEQLLKNDQPPNCELFVAKEDHQIRAFALIYSGYDLSSDSYGYHLADICVASAYRGQGIGTEMMKYLANHTLKEGKEWISLTVLEQNEHAQRFYQRLGLENVPVNFMAIGKNMLSSMLG